MTSAVAESVWHVEGWPFGGDSLLWTLGILGLLMCLCAIVAGPPQGHAGPWWLALIGGCVLFVFCAISLFM